MRLSKLFGKTTSDVDASIALKSHKLLLKAGYIRESTAGRYFFLPLGMRVHNKIEEVIRKIMDKHDAQEMVSPILHPLELWKETNRTSTAGFELMKITDRRGADFALGGTAEEMFVDVVRKFNISYKDLPFNIYQFSNKFRDEMRARGGLLRVREFVMKDAYSFSTEEQFKAIYDDMWQAYDEVYKALGLNAHSVEADGGYIGGDYCHEFVVESEAGESRFFIEDGSNYVAHEDVANVQLDEDLTTGHPLEIKEVAADRAKTMQAGADFHKLPMHLQIKDVLYYDEQTQTYLLVIIRGDLEVNETKLTKYAKYYSLRAATNQEVIDDVGSYPGFISPVGISKTTISGKKLMIVADDSLKGAVNLYGGANKKHVDLLNICIDRDTKVDIWADVKLAQAGMKGPNGGVLVEKRGIEVGNIFQLGYHYTSLMQGADYTDVEGNRKPLYMGCYGIGLGRTMASIVEILSDEKGIIWPETISPYQYHLVVLGKEDNTYEVAEEFYQKLLDLGVEVLFDDRRDEGIGRKLGDSELIGIPKILIISDRNLKEGNVLELKHRVADLQQNDTKLEIDDFIKSIMEV